MKKKHIAHIKKPNERILTDATPASHSSCVYPIASAAASCSGGSSSQVKLSTGASPSLFQSDSVYPNVV